MKKYLLFFTILIPHYNYAQLIPSAQRIDWSKAGVEGAIPALPNSVDVTLFGAIPNDTIDDYAAVVNVIATLNGQAGVVFFPPGNYIFLAAINLPDSIILRGSGASTTHFYFNFNNNANNCINISHGQSASFTPIVSGYDKDSKKIIVTNASLNYVAGDAIEIQETNGTWDTNPAAWAVNSVGHVSSIDSVVADTIYLREAIRINFDAALNPVIRKIITRTHCGLECFSMTRVDSAATSVNFGVNFSYAFNCWISGVEIYKTIGAEVFAEASNHLTITGSYFHDAYLYDGTSTRGYGVALAVHTGACLMENNIFKHLRHAMMVKQGANGNVFAYNYSLQPNRSEPINDFAGDISSHGHYAFANLFEGNVVQNIMIDQAWGPTGPYNTFFRNRAELYGLVMSTGTVQSDAQNFVGNDITNSGAFMGLYVKYGTAHFEHGNNVKGTIMPSGTQVLSDSSYYLTAAPSYWNMAIVWPNIGTPNTPGATIPALDRYNAGNYTVCNNGVVTDVHLPNENNLLLTISNVHSTNNAIVFTINNAVTEKFQFRLYDLFGKTIQEKELKLESTKQEIKIDLNKNIADGMYLVSVFNSNQTVSFKCLK